MNGKRILLVEDDPMVRDWLQTVLSRDGHHVQVAADADEALQRFAPGQFDVVLTDLGLPGKQGNELADELKRIDPAQKIILMSGFPPEARPVSCDLMVRKPLSPAELRSALAALG